MKKHSANIILLLVVATVVYISCKKEYSFEGAIPGSIPTDTTIVTGDTTRPADTIHYTDFNLPVCSSCEENKALLMNEWSFKVGNSYVCGIIDTAILTYERTSFTFFGPSKCVADNGLIFSVYLSPYKLDHDVNNFNVPYAAYYYYHTGNPNILSNQTDHSFKLTITSYNHTTKVTTGTFSGTAYTQDNKLVQVVNGRFKTKLF